MQVMHDLPHALRVSFESARAGIDERLTRTPARISDKASSFHFPMHERAKRRYRLLLYPETARSDARKIVHLIDETMLLARARADRYRARASPSSVPKLWSFSSEMVLTMTLSGLRSELDSMRTSSSFMTLDFSATSRAARSRAAKPPARKLNGDARQQLTRVEGLRQVVISAGARAHRWTHPRSRARTRTMTGTSARSGSSRNAPRRLKPVEARHHEIGHDEIRHAPCALSRAPTCRPTRSRPSSARCRIRRRYTAHIRVVIDDEDPSEASTGTAARALWTGAAATRLCGHGLARTALLFFPPTPILPRYTERPPSRCPVRLGSAGLLRRQMLGSSP